MNKHQYVFAVLFMVILLGFAAFNIWDSGDSLIKDIKDLEQPQSIQEVKAYTSSIDSTLTSNLPFGHMWNETYAKIHNVLGKNEENSFKYVRDKNGFMHSSNFWGTTSVSGKEIAQRLKRLQEKVEDEDTKLVVMLYAEEYNEAWTDAYYGIPYADYGDFNDDLTRYLRYYGVEYIDFQQIYKEKGYKAEDIFYKTDHHWTTQRAFEGFQILTKHLNKEHGAGLSTYYLDKDNYNYEFYKQSFLGSQGRDAGVSFSGMDDYTLIVPKFHTDYEYYRYDGDEEEIFKGSIEDTLITRRYFEYDDIYDRNLWNSYTDGLHMSEKITNKLNEDGLDVLFLRDSFASPVATFFSSYCHEIDMVWTVKAETEFVEKKIEEKNYDYVFVAMVVDSYVNGGTNFYLEEEGKDE